VQKKLAHPDSCRCNSEALSRLDRYGAKRRGEARGPRPVARRRGGRARRYAGHASALAGRSLGSRRSSESCVPGAENLNKRVVRAPKIFSADSGIVHALLDVRTPRDLMRHPKLGASWERFLIEPIRRLMVVREAPSWEAARR